MRRSLHSLALALALASCAFPEAPIGRDPTDAEYGLIHTAERLWSVEIGSTQCCHPREVDVLITGDEGEFWRACGTTLDRAAGCFTWPGAGATGDGTPPTLVLAEDAAATAHDRLISHEALHWLEWCTEYGISYDHTGPVWTRLYPRLVDRP